MKNAFLLLVAALLVLFLGAYMFLYQVNYDEVAVLATFEKATPESIKREPGLKPCWPRPIQHVYTYSTRLQVIDGDLTEQMTADGAAVIVRTMVTWKIDDPLAFFQSVQNVEEARKRLDAPIKTQVHSALGKYRLDQFVNTDPARTMVTIALDAKGQTSEAEQVSAWEAVQRTVLAALNQQLAANKYGIKIEQVGIRRMVLPGEITTNVAAAMRSNRERLAAGARQEGESLAATIEAEANRAKENILAFANRRAAAIRTEGQTEAAGYYSIFNQNEDLAIFLSKIEAAKKIFAHNTTFLLDAGTMGLQDLTGGRKATTRPAP